MITRVEQLREEIARLRMDILDQKEGNRDQTAKMEQK